MRIGFYGSNIVALNVVFNESFYSLLLQRIRIEEIRNDEWFKRGYVPAKLIEYEDVNLDDVNAVFDDPEVRITFSFYASFSSQFTRDKK